MAKPPIRILVVEDFEPFREFVTSALAQDPELQVIGELSDGLEAVAAAAELRPELVLLDIDLPSLNGIAAARRIREHSPQSKILFVSGGQSADIVEQALSTGAAGYLVKSEAGRQLLAAVAAVLQGKHYISPSLSGLRVNYNEQQPASTHALLKPKITQELAKTEITGHHEVVFFFDDQQLLDRLSQFIGPILNAGNAAIVVATGPHRKGLMQSLQAYGVDIAAALEQGRYIALDVADTLSSCMVNGMFDSARFLQSFEDLTVKATTAAQGKPPRAAFFGEAVDLLWKQGDVETAIQLEKFGTQLCKRYPVDILCGYAVGIQGIMEQEAIQRICAEHSAVHHA